MVRIGKSRTFQEKSQFRARDACKIGESNVPAIVQRYAHFVKIELSTKEF